MAYDGTDSVFNDLFWVANFGLPSVKTLLCGTYTTSWMVDLDIGDMFWKFMLDFDARKYVDVDVNNQFSEDMSANQRFLWIHWYRCAMGLKPPPNHTTREILFAEEFLLVNPQLMSNPFQYLSLTNSPPCSPGVLIIGRWSSVPGA